MRGMCPEKPSSRKELSGSSFGRRAPPSPSTMRAHPSLSTAGRPAATNAPSATLAFSDLPRSAESPVRGSLLPEQGRTKRKEEHNLREQIRRFYFFLLSRLAAGYLPRTMPARLLSRKARGARVTAICQLPMTVSSSALI